MEPEAADRLLDKIRAFVAGLDEYERALFAALIAPGVARAYAGSEVEGFGIFGWSPTALPESLIAALRARGVRVEGLEP